MLTEGRVDRKVKHNKDRKKQTNMAVGYFMVSIMYKLKLSEQPEV